MRNIQYRGIHHIDGTYKITCFGYPLLVYGVSDHSGHLHPVCFAIVSGESKEDFKHFYKGLIDLSVELKLSYMPEFIMQDAQSASKAGTFEFFKDTFVMDFIFFSTSSLKLLNFSSDTS